MLVCLGPGILLTKLFDQPGSSGLQTVSIYIFYAGAILCGFWSYGLKKMEEARNDEERSDEEIPKESPRHSYSLEDLILLCGGDTTMAMKLMENESTVTPGISFPEALRRAYVRRSLEIGKSPTSLKI